MRKSKKPLLVNLSGMRSSGVSVACGRVSRALTSMGFNTTVVTLRSGGDVLAFGDSLVLNDYADFDVVIFDKHFYTETAVRRQLKTPLWFDDDTKPNLSVLMTPMQSPNNRHKFHLQLRTEHFGTTNHCVVSTAGRDGKLYAAGNIKKLILEELLRE